MSSGRRRETERISGTCLAITSELPTETHTLRKALGLCQSAALPCPVSRFTQGPMRCGVGAVLPPSGAAQMLIPELR